MLFGWFGHYCSLYAAGDECGIGWRHLRACGHSDVSLVGQSRFYSP